MSDLQSGRAVSRRYRNRRIGEFLKELDLTEGRSTGISKILKVMEANGSGKPEFETDDDRSYFLVRLPIHPKEKITPTVTGKASEKTSEKILKEVRNNSKVTIAILAEQIGVSTRSIERNLKNLQDSGRLERVGSASGGYWAVIDEPEDN